MNRGHLFGKRSAAFEFSASMGELKRTRPVTVLRPEKGALPVIGRV
jgi:hypothetical protein